MAGLAREEQHDIRAAEDVPEARVRAQALAHGHGLRRLRHGAPVRLWRDAGMAQLWHVMCILCASVHILYHTYFITNKCHACWSTVRPSNLCSLLSDVLVLKAAEAVDLLVQVLCVDACGCVNGVHNLSSLEWRLFERRVHSLSSLSELGWLAELTLINLARACAVWQCMRHWVCVQSLLLVHLGSSGLSYWQIHCTHHQRAHFDSSLA